MDNKINIIQNMFRNELQKTDLQAKERRLILSDAKVFSNVMDNVMVVSNPNLEVFNRDGNLAFTLSTAVREVLTSVISEYTLKSQDLNGVVNDELSQQLAEKIDKEILKELTAKAQEVATEGTTTTEKILALKDKLTNNSFVIMVGLEDYLNILNLYHGQFPYKVIYNPLITDKSIFAFKKQCVYVNILLDRIESRKNVLTGAYNFALNILGLQVGCKDVFKI